MTEVPSSSRRILVVDDEPDVRAYLARLFQDNGYEASSAADGAEALEAVRKQRPDLITLDLSMPNKSGVGFYREIRSIPGYGGIPVVFVTAVAGPGGDSGVTERFYSTRRQVPPPDGFVAKPVDPDEILQLVRRLMAGEKA
jgi:CheY-like chemotaxis protein